MAWMDADVHAILVDGQHRQAAANGAGLRDV